MGRLITASRCFVRLDVYRGIAISGIAEGSPRDAGRARACASGGRVGPGTAAGFIAAAVGTRDRCAGGTTTAIGAASIGAAAVGDHVAVAGYHGPTDGGGSSRTLPLAPTATG